MFSSIFSVSDPKGAATFYPTTSERPPNELFGELEPVDTEWACSKGSVTETQTWYNVLEDGTLVMCQVIHSSIGPWHPNIQFTFNIYNPTTKEQMWRSANVSNFATPPRASGGVTYDKRSSRADEFTVIHKSDGHADGIAESYTINAKPSKDIEVALVISRPASVPGFKLGKGPAGGFSNFGPDPAKREGYVVHRFWPRTMASGHIVKSGQTITANGPGMFVHAIQGMRPNLVASRWNFANFQSEECGGVSAIQMEFTTLDRYGRTGSGSGGVKVNVGALVVGGKLVTVTGETAWPDEPLTDDALVKSRATHLDTHKDSDTKYSPPSRIEFEWAGPSVVHSVQGNISAKLAVDVGTPEAPKGLVAKVDVLAEIPKVVKAFVNYVAGTKPYIYQWLNPSTLEVSIPGTLISDAGDNELKTISVKGSFYNEATFIS
ncbi:oxidative stress survival, Svf1-like protein [Ramaria rubella]|nr:oxidative stress survival, Svf1-like protein [Ramaria rubella]